MSEDYNSEDYKKTLLLFLESAFSQLNHMEEKLMKLRLVDRLSYDEVGKEFGVTSERIKQVEAKAIRKIKSLFDYPVSDKWKVEKDSEDSEEKTLEEIVKELAL
jgi:DNA-directed RNA polymerase sigma subunit (sigma70/sigma32)